jgi:hypothetical protein
MQLRNAIFVSVRVLNTRIAPCVERFIRIGVNHSACYVLTPHDRSYVMLRAFALTRTFDFQPRSLTAFHLNAVRWISSVGATVDWFLRATFDFSSVVVLPCFGIAPWSCTLLLRARLRVHEVICSCELPTYFVPNDFNRVFDLISLTILWKVWFLRTASDCSSTIGPSCFGPESWSCRFVATFGLALLCDYLFLRTAKRLCTEERDLYYQYSNVLSVFTSHI